MSKQYAYIHAMAKTSVKFQNDWPKTVGGVALTSQLPMNGQTDERTNWRVTAHLLSHPRANASATKVVKKYIRVNGFTSKRVFGLFFKGKPLQQKYFFASLVYESLLKWANL